MSNFKYSLNCSFTLESTQEEFIKKLKELGYKQFLSHYEANIIAVNGNKKSGNEKYNGEYKLLHSTYFERDYTFNIENKWEFEAALAIATIHDDDIPHVGEWIKSTEYIIKGSPFKSCIYNGEGLRKIIQVSTNNVSFNVTPYNHCFQTTLLYNPKATPEEIIEYMKEKYMEKEIKLPENWVIQGGRELETFMDEHNKIGRLRSFDNTGSYSEYYYYKRGINLSNYNEDWDYAIEPVGEIITVSQFKEWLEYEKSKIESENKLKMEKKSFVIKGPIDKKQDLFYWFTKVKKGNIGGYREDGFYTYNINTDKCSFVERNHTKFDVITYEEWKEMFKDELLEIEGYKLIKEYPNVEVSVNTVVLKSELSSYGLENLDFSKYSEYWEPVYKQRVTARKIRVECSEPFDVLIKSGTDIIEAPERFIDIHHLKNLQKSLKQTTPRFNNWNFEINSVNIGCKKEIPFHYLETIITHWDELNKK